MCEGYEREVDRIMADHHLAMARWEVEELIEMGIGTMEAIDRIDARWREAVRTGGSTHLVEQGFELRNAIARCDLIRAKLLHVIDRLERSGHVISGASRYRRATIVPFDERPLEMEFSEDQLQSLAALQPKAPEVAYPEDDAL